MSHKLTDIQHQIETQGFSIVPDVIDSDTADKARNILHELLHAESTDEATKAGSQRVGGIAVKHPLFLDLLCHPLIIEIWQRILGPDIICSSWSANTVYPGHDRLGWHVDYPYWSKQPPWPGGFLAGQTVWMLDDFNEHNGATGVVPGSHRKGHPPDGPTDTWREDGHVLCGTKGSVVLANGAWWHTARPNLSQQPRSCLLGMYIMPWFLPQEDMEAQLEQIQDPSQLVQQLLGARQHKPRTVG